MERPNTTHSSLNSRDYMGTHTPTHTNKKPEEKMRRDMLIFGGSILSLLACLHGLLLFIMGIVINAPLSLNIAVWIGAVIAFMIHGVFIHIAVWEGIL